MPSIGEIYNPLIDAALAHDERGHQLLTELGRAIHEVNPDLAKTFEEGVEAAKANLDYYCQYFSAPTERQVKDFYQLGAGYRTVIGLKLPALPHAKERDD